jgi:DNA-binding CsgD family transcriptional regulator
MRGKLRSLVDDLAGAIADVERARRLVPAGDDQALGRVCISHAIMVSGYARRSSEAAEAARAALEHASRADDTRTIGQARAMLGAFAVHEGRIDEGIEEMLTALGIARELAEPEDLAMAGVGLTYAYCLLGDTEKVLTVADTIQPELRRLTVDEYWLEGMVENNAVDMLYLAGRWDEALSRDDKGRSPSGLALKAPALARIQLARGNVQTAVDLMRGQELLAYDDQPQWKRDYAEAEALLLLAQQRPHEALALALEAAEVSHGTDDELVSGDLLRVGLEAAVAACSPDGFERLVALLSGAVSGVEASALAAVVDGERSRLRGTPDPAPWLAAAQDWASRRRPYWEAQARLRAAEALLARRGARGAAAAELQAARQLAEELGAAPLLGQIRELAKLARIRLDDAVTEHPEHPEHQASAAGPFPQLTDRERQVLSLLRAGRTNREIGAALYMSPKTASVHVTHILEKLGVQTRVQAAAEAVRLDLARDPDPPT